MRDPMSPVSVLSVLSELVEVVDGELDDEGTLHAIGCAKDALALAEVVIFLPTHHYAFRCGQPALVVAVEEGAAPDGSPRLCYRTRWPDGVVDQTPCFEEGIAFDLHRIPLGSAMAPPVTLLRRLEWSGSRGWPNGEIDDCCPDCRAWRGDLHESGCELAVAIDAPRQPQQPRKR